MPKIKQLKIEDKHKDLPLQSSPNIKITLQIHTKETDIPRLAKFKLWANAVLPEAKKDKEITIRIVNKQESAKFNELYRGKKVATNILSFALESEDESSQTLLGDLLICAPLVREEAKAQNKSLEAHWAHLVIHGILHLLNYKHNTNKNARTMEKLEIKILKQLGFPNPY